MRLICKVAFIMTIAGLFGCEKQVEYSEVEKYINQLKSNQYGVMGELPAFKTSDIPALLKYRNETKVITNFPHNGISSLWMPDCKLGMYVLWTIESIRAVEIKSQYLIGRFPSQNPVLALRDASELKLVNDDKSHKEAAQAYFDWWYALNIFTDKMSIDPLKDTKYRWH
jgi:hypothetical protein